MKMEKTRAWRGVRLCDLLRVGLKSFFAAFLLLQLVGCVITPSAVDGEKLKPNQGLLVLKVSATENARLGFLDYSDTSTFESRFAENMKGPKGFVFAKTEPKYVVIPLDAGEYMWSKVEKYPHFAWLQASNRFRISPNSITYIGDIRLNFEGGRFQMRVADREAEVRQYLYGNFPVYLLTMPIVKSLAEFRY